MTSFKQDILLILLRACILICTLALHLFNISTVLADKAEFTYWTWHTPMHNAAGRDNVIQMVKARGNLDPDSAAHSVATTILNRNLKSEQIAITFTSFAQRHSETALYNFPTDRLSDGQRTIWFKNGIEHNKQWFYEFIISYLYRQFLDPELPPPGSFFFDTEGLPEPHKINFLGSFDLMRADSRWDSEPISGFNGLTLADLYYAAGSPTYNPALSWNHQANREFMKWIASISYTAADAAMAEVAYNLINLVFPNCRTSNYGSSKEFDGQGDPARFERHGNALWYEWTRFSAASNLAPVYYWNPTLERMAEELDFMSASAPDKPIIPWIPLPETTDATQGLFSTAMFLSRFNLVKNKGVKELIIWSNSTSEESEVAWNNFAAAIDEYQALVTLECPEDFDRNGTVNLYDLLILLADWGICLDCMTDLNDSGTVDVQDLLLLLSAWGTCN